MAENQVNASDTSLVITSAMRLDKEARKLLFESRIEHAESMPDWLKAELLHSVISAIADELARIRAARGSLLNG